MTWLVERFAGNHVSLPFVSVDY